MTIGQRSNSVHDAQTIWKFWNCSGSGGFQMSSIAERTSPATCRLCGTEFVVGLINIIVGGMPWPWGVGSPIQIDREKAAVAVTAIQVYKRNTARHGFRGRKQLRDLKAVPTSQHLSHTEQDHICCERISVSHTAQCRGKLCHEPMTS